VRPHLEAFDAAVFTMREFVPPDLAARRVEIVPPAIDPLSPKNMPLPEDTARRILEWIGVPLDRPLITQVSRFDPWKDPLGVIEAYRLARREVPGLQLALVGSMALDDPEGTLDLADRHPWESMARHLKGVTLSPRFFGFAYVATGEA